MFLHKYTQLKYIYLTTVQNLLLVLIIQYVLLVQMHFGIFHHCQSSLRKCMYVNL